jgi:hypothetical protein
VIGVQEFKPNETAEPVYRTWLLERRTPLTGDSLTNAFVAFDSEKNQYYVAMKFDRRGADVFERLTTNNVKRKMAIVLDDVVDSAPVIEGPDPERQRVHHPRRLQEPAGGPRRRQRAVAGAQGGRAPRARVPAGGAHGRRDAGRRRGREGQDGPIGIALLAILAS